MNSTPRSTAEDPVARAAPSSSKHAIRHFRSLDGMRGILACVVVLFHLGLNPLLSRLTRGWIQAGEWGLCVDFFFLLSGFVLFFSFKKKVPNLAEDAYKRARRLAPLYLVTTIFIMILLPGRWQLHVVIANLLMLQSFLGLESINAPGWSVSFEMFVPALALIVVPRLSRMQRGSTLQCAIVLLVAYGLILGLTGMEQRFLRSFLGLMTGFTLGRVFDSKRQDYASFVPLSLYLPVSMILIALSGTFGGLLFLFPALFAVGILLGSNDTGILSTAPFQLLGKWSYAIYLWHIPALILVERMFGSADGSVVRKLLVIGITMILSALSYSAIEARIQKRSGPVQAQTAP